MKKIVAVFLSVVITMSVAALAFALEAPGTGIKLTAHDMSSTGGGHNYGDTVEQAGLDRICIYCHAPHHTAKPTDPAYLGTVDYLPLWNHAVTANAWTTYSNGLDEPLDGDHASYAEANSGDPGAVSKLCLSCHDGSIAANAYGFAPSSSRHDLTGAPDAFILPNTRVSIGFGGDLSNHHPIGFVYDDAKLSDNEIAASTEALGSANTIGDLLWQGKMECSTCHDVHNTENEGLKLIWAEDNNSAFCLSCHLK